MPDINATLTQTVISATVTNPADIVASLGQTLISATLEDGIDINGSLSQSPIAATLVNGGTITATITETPIEATVTNGLADAPSDGVTYGRQDGGWVAVAGGVTDHAALSNLDYASAGHTGFQATLTADVDYLTPATAILTYQPIGSYLTDAPSDGTTYGRKDGGWIAVSSGVTDHGALTGLADDDHTQYVLVDGTRALSGYLDFAEIATPSDPAANTLRVWAEDAGGFGQMHFRNSSGLDYQLARDNIHTVRNNTGSTITKGAWVYINGSTGIFPTVALAKADSETTLPAMGIVVADIVNNAFGQVMTLGDVQGIDTSAFSEGDVLYVSAATAGAVTTTKPTGANIVQRVGVVVSSSVGNGIIAVLVGSEFSPLPLAANLGGTGVANAAGSTLTLGGATTISTGGTLALGGHTLTVPATGTAALLATENVFTANQKINVNSTNALLVEQDGVKDNVLVVDTINGRVGVNENSLSYGFNVGGLGLIARIGNTSTGVVGSVLAIGDVGSGTSKANAFIGSYNNSGPVLYLSSNVYWSNSAWTKTDSTKKSVRISMEGGNIYFSTGVVGALPVGRWTVHNSGGIAIGNTYRNTDPGSNNMIVEGAHGVGVSVPLAKEHLREVTTITNTIKEVLRIDAIVSTTSTGSAAGFGVGQSFYAETATDGTYQQQGLISTEWIDATNVSRKAKMSLSAYDTAARLGLEIEADGSAAKIGVLGASPIVRQAHIVDADGTLADVTNKLNSLLAYLENFGFIATS